MLYDFALDDSKVTLIVGGIALALSGMLLWYYFHAKRLLNEMWAIDTYDARELRRMCSDGFDAIVEVQGQVSCDEPITSLAAEFPCCWARTRVERRVRSVNQTKSGVRESYEWRKDFDKTYHTIFKVTDGTGYILVDPSFADIEAEKPHVIIVDERKPWFEGVGASETGEYRITEEIFVPTGYAFVLGQASACGEGTSPDVLIHYPSEGYLDPDARTFIISRKSEKQLNAMNAITLRICVFGAILGFGIALYCALHLLGPLP